MMKKGPCAREEDVLLSSYISREGEGQWKTLPKKTGFLCCRKSCRLPWMNYLSPSIKWGNTSADEEDLILPLHHLLGNRWSLVVGRIPGHTDNEIKNYWSTHLWKKLISQGIDPKTHKPLSSPVSSSLNPNQNLIHSSSSAISPNSDDNISKSNPNSVETNDQMTCGNEDKSKDDTHSSSPDDAFSSFLDLLIDEEMCNEQTPTA